MKHLLIISLSIFSCTGLVAAHIDVKIVNSLDTLPCWANAENLINTCKKYLVAVQEYTSKESNEDLLKAAQDDVLLAAQVSIDASFNACQTILNISSAIKLSKQNSNMATSNVEPRQY